MFFISDYNFVNNFISNYNYNINQRNLLVITSILAKVILSRLIIPAISCLIATRESRCKDDFCNPARDKGLMKPFRFDKTGL